MKLLWQLLKFHDNLWVSLVKKKYFKTQDVLAHMVSSVASWQWRKLMSLRPLFKKRLRWQIGNGRDIIFWDDNWVFQYPISQIVSPPPGSEELKVSDVLNEFGRWDRCCLDRLVPAHVGDQVVSLFLPSFPQVDTVIWGLTADGQYSVKTGAMLAQGLLNPNFEKVEFNWLWKFNVPRKVKFFFYGKLAMMGCPQRIDLKNVRFLFLGNVCSAAMILNQ